MFEPLTVATRKKVRGFSLSADTSALVDEMALKHGVSASRVVDVALNRYLKHLETISPEQEVDSNG